MVCVIVKAQNSILLSLHRIFNAFYWVLTSASMLFWVTAIQFDALEMRINESKKNRRFFHVSLFFSWLNMGIVQSFIHGYGRNSRGFDARFGVVFKNLMLSTVFKLLKRIDAACIIYLILPLIFICMHRRNILITFWNIKINYKIMRTEWFQS